MSPRPAGRLAVVWLLVLAAVGRAQEAEPAAPPSPWYADGELAVLFNGAVHYNGHFGTVDGDSAVYLSPRVYLGRHLSGGGAVRFTYRNMTEVGHPGTGDRPAGWSSDPTFSTNWFDLDYVGREFAPLDWWRLRCEAGGRLVYRHHGLRREDQYASSESRASYFGGGPHLGLRSDWLLGPSGWAIYSRADTAVTFGGTRATYRYRPKTRPNSWGFPDSPHDDRDSFGECQFDLGLQLGLARRGLWRGRAVGLAAGVQMDVLTVGSLGGSSFDAAGLVNAGPFVRVEVGF